MYHNILHENQINLNAKVEKGKIKSEVTYITYQIE